MVFQLASSFSLAASQREGASTKASENTFKVEDSGARPYRQIWYVCLQHKTLLLVFYGYLLSVLGSCDAGEYW